MMDDPIAQLFVALRGVGEANARSARATNRWRVVWLLCFLAALVVALASCVSSRGGLPLTMQAQSDGRAALGYDGNTSAVAFDGSGRAAVVESEAGLPVYPPLAWEGRGLLVRVRELPDAPDGFSGSFELGPDGLVVVPSWLLVYLRVLPPAPWYTLQAEEQQDLTAIQ